MPRGLTTNRGHDLIGKLSATVMIFILLWKTFELLVFAPLAGGEHVRDYLPFAIELLIGLISLILSLRKHHIASFAAACLLACAALAYWRIVICRGSNPVWSDLEWLMIPDFIFAAAVLLRWFSRPRSETDFHQGPMEAVNV
jgi:hypothetical protein